MKSKLVVLWPFALLAACSEPSPAPTPTESPSATSASDADIAKAEREAATMAPPQALPKGAPEAPVTGFCRDAECTTQRVVFANRDWPGAWKGDYQAQRNVAYCRADGCQGAVQISHVDACAWRAVVVQKHPAEADDTDAANLKNDCGQLDDAARATAIRKADDLLARLKSARP